MQVMSRRVIGLIAVLTLLLQGLAFAAAGVSDQSAGEHCDTHMTKGEDCGCCTDVLSASGCATLCAPGAMLPVAGTSFPPMHAEAPPHIVQLARAGPEYIPLTPPPIRSH